jgi:hypothetical protein
MGDASVLPAASRPKIACRRSIREEDFKSNTPVLNPGPHMMEHLGFNRAQLWPRWDRREPSFASGSEYNSTIGDDQPGRPYQPCHARCRKTAASAIRKVAYASWHWGAKKNHDMRAEDKCATVALLPPASRPAVSALFFQCVKLTRFGGPPNISRSPRWRRRDHYWVPDARIAVPSERSQARWKRDSEADRFAATSWASSGSVCQQRGLSWAELWGEIVPTWRFVTALAYLALLGSVCGYLL